MKLDLSSYPLHRVVGFSQFIHKRLRRLNSSVKANPISPSPQRAFFCLGENSLRKNGPTL
ncbi:hypothetical protein EMIT0373P_20613 [Pseudomonas chlororaphis]